MAFTDLTNEEQAAVNAYVRDARAMIGELARLRNRVVALDAMYGNIQGLLSAYGAGHFPLWAKAAGINGMVG